MEGILVDSPPAYVTLLHVRCSLGYWNAKDVTLAQNILFIIVAQSLSSSHIRITLSIQIHVVSVNDRSSAISNRNIWINVCIERGGWQNLSHQGSNLRHS